MLVEGSLAAPKRIRRAIVQPPGQQPFYLPDKLAARELPPFREVAPRTSQQLGRVRITVPAGTFTAEHQRSKDKGGTVEVWTSPEVPAWPMVKMSTPEMLIELTGHGEKATSAVRGKPAKLPESLLKGP